MNDEMVWVTFVGGPLDEQSRKLERWRNTYDAAYSHEINNWEMGWSFATYKIERHWEGKPGSHREWFTGVLI